jgi:uncharacterized membrane protein
MTIRNPIEWSADQVEQTAQALKSFGSALRPDDAYLDSAQPEIRRIRLSDLKDVLRSGFRDFETYRTDVIFIGLIFPLIGLVLANLTLSFHVLPLLPPLILGFALIGPFAAAGLYEMSRRQEQGQPVSWTDAFDIFRSPSIAAIIKLGLLLTGIFVLWIMAAIMIYRLTLGTIMPASISSFATAVFTTSAGWALIVAGFGVGALFALVVLAISVVSFPMLLDRRVRISTAVRTSVRAVIINPVPMAAWGVIIAASLLLGTIPALVGLIVVMPVLGHATWHLYRKMVAR